MACLDDDAIAALLAGVLRDAERTSIVEHIDECAECRALVADAARRDATDHATRVHGSSVGRYVVLETVGAGAMGVVYAAYDPELDRKVALKVLRNDPSDDRSSREAMQGQLLREAKALARVAHPNVITIYDVGTIDGEVFIAMEFVAGGTLGDWLAARGRAESVRAIVEMFRQAGEGLAAAHGEGLEHRDFKPDNVLIGPSGRVRVTDFGLARVGGRAVDPGGRAVDPVGRAAATADATTTMTGALVGTPAYMAPERLAGEPGDARSDQFSFCVALYEALYGERPFGGGDVAALAIDQDKALRTPNGGHVPVWLRRLVLRGLAKAPDARFPTMRALLDAIASGMRTRPRVAAIAGVLLVGLAAVALASGRLHHTEPPVCTGAESAWGQTWPSDQAEAMRAAFARSGRASATSAFDAVSRVLDRYHTEWIDMHRDTCEATRVRGEQSDALLDLRMRCLEGQRKQVAALVSVLAEADAGVVDRSVAAALALPPVADCANTLAISSAVPLPDGSARAAIDALGDRLAEARALDYAGLYTRGLEIARPAVAAARATGYAPILAKLLFVSGRLTSGRNEFSEAEGLLQEAAAVAMDAREDLVAADAWTQLVRVVGMNDGRVAEAKIYARYAEAAIHRSGGDLEREATRLRFLATVVWKRERKLEEGRALITRARELFAASRSDRYDFDVASCDEGIAGIDFEEGQLEQALPLHRHVAEVRERLFGGRHPSVATALVNVGEDLTKLGRIDEAIPILERALAIAADRADTGADAYFHHRLAAALRAKDDARAALVEDERSHAASQRAGETGGYWESFPLTGIGLDLVALGRGADAVAPLERAIELRQQTPVPFELAEARFGLARALATSRDPAARTRARALARQASADLADDAQRYGSWFATSRAEIDAWLAKPDSL